MQTIFDVTRNVLGFMASGPASLAKTLVFSARDDQVVAKFTEHIRAASSSDSVFNLLNRKLSGWDYDGGATWASGTRSNTAERRARIYELLEIDGDLAKLFDDKFPPNLVSCRGCC